MTDTTNNRGDGAAEAGAVLAPDGTLAAWVRQAMDRAAACGIDPQRVLLALGVPPDAHDAGPRDDVSRRGASGRS